jgi:hypothetical protein
MTVNYPRFPRFGIGDLVEWNNEIHIVVDVLGSGLVLLDGHPRHHAFRTELLQPLSPENCKKSENK